MGRGRNSPHTLVKAEVGFFQKKKNRIPCSLYIHKKIKKRDIKNKKIFSKTCPELNKSCVYITQRNKESIMKKTLINISETSTQYVITWVFNESMERWEVEDVEKV